MLLPPLKTWKPITVSPPDTAFGLLYFVAMVLLYVAVFHAFASESSWRRLLRAVVYVGMGMTFVGLVQAAAGTQKFYGLLGPEGMWAMFGPFLVRSHFGGYMVMAIGIALGFTAEALTDLQRDWSRRRVGWLALGDPAGTAMVQARRRGHGARRGSRGRRLARGLHGLRRLPPRLCRAHPPAAAPRRRGRGGGGRSLLDRARRHRPGLRRPGHRGQPARHVARHPPDVPRLPASGGGLERLRHGLLRYQTFWRYYFVQAAHNEYLELLLTTGLVGSAVGLWAFARLLRPALARALRSPLDAGLFSGLLGLACHNLVDFNWQILPNAATFVALLALAVRPLDRTVGDP